jgi:tRNA A-37 threonylcarbamoyl transferase component Bud32
MKLGSLIGKGTTSEVYEWGSDSVLKLFIKKYSYDSVKHEADIGYRIHQEDMPAPAVYDIIKVNNRSGIIFERIFGESVLEHVKLEPWNINYYSQQMAGLHFKIHQHSLQTLPSQKKILASAIKLSSDELGDKVKRILAYLESLPEGGSVCHGDLHFSNIIVSDNGLVAIDWMNAYKGNPLGDVARTCMTIRSPRVPANMAGIMAVSYKYGRLLTYWGYLNEYMRIAHVTPDEIDAWILPVAAARLKDKIPGEKNWLLDIIDEHLRILDEN